VERTAGQRHGHLWSLALLAGIIGLLTAHTLSREYAELIFGIDAAGETSDVVLTRHDLTLNPWSIRLSQRTRCIIRDFWHHQSCHRGGGDGDQQPFGCRQFAALKSRVTGVSCK
jgi:hypothetical protein